MPTIDEDDLITWAHKEPTLDELHKASDLADELSEAAFSEDTETAREKVLEMVGLLWPATT